VKKFVNGLAIAAAITVLAYFFIIYLPQAFAGNISPKAEVFSLNGFSLRWYGLLIALSIVLSYFLVLRDFANSKIDPVLAENSVFLVVILGIIGARLGYVIQNIDYYFANPVDILGFRSGGLSIHGAIILGIAGIFLAQKVYKIKFIDLANTISPYLFLSAAIGRFGNFFNQEIVGWPTNVAWKMYVEANMRPAGFESYQYFHPVFLYESILLIIFFAIYKLFMYRKYGPKYGFGYTLIFYAITRIVVEFFRIDYRPILLNLDLAQLVSFAMVISGIVIIFWRKDGTRKR
jgi:phosphatidylglycerol:prolipoprotein diacylglycerol transferase